MNLHQNQKGMATIIYIIIGVLLGVVLVTIMTKLKTSTILVDEKDNDSGTNSLTCVQANWQNLLPQIQQILVVEIDPQSGAGAQGSISILEERDLTGDGCTEAIVSAGVGGAYTSLSLLFRMENATVILAEKKEQNGDINNVSFESGASVRNQLGYELLPDQNAFYTIYKQTNDNGSGPFVESCAVSAYIWNPTSKLFDYDGSLTDQVSTNTCVL